MATSGSFNTKSYDGRYYTLSWTATQSIENNTSTIAWTLTANGGNSGWYAERTVKVVIADETVYSKTDRVTRYKGTVATGSKTIWHDTYGEKSFTASVQAAVYTSSVNCTGSGSFDLDPIPRKSSLSLSASEVEMGKALTLTIEKASSDFTDNLWYDIGNGWVWVAGNVTSGYRWTIPTAFERNTPNDATSIVVTVAIDTYYGDTFIGTTAKTFTATVPASYKPSCKANITDPTGYADKYGAYIKGQSKFKIEVIGSTSCNSPIVSYTVNANGATYNKSSVTTGLLGSAGELTVTASVKDKRGRTSDLYEALCNAVDYSAPRITLLKVKRCKADGTEDIRGEYVQVTFSASITALNNLNSAKYTLEYKKQKDTNYTSIEFDGTNDTTDLTNIYEVTETSYIFAADSGSSYNVRVIAADDFTDDKKPTVASTGAVMEHWRADGKGLGLGKVGEIENGLDVGYIIRANEGFINIPLEENTDFDDLKTPNTYTSYDKVASTYKNCPCTYGTFTLEVVSGGNEGQVMQTLTFTSKEDMKVWKRHYHSSAWGEWHLVYTMAGNLLWAGVQNMHNGQTATLAEKVSEQPNGIILVFSAYSDGVAQNWAFNHCYVHKYAVNNHGGKGNSFWLTDATENVGIKYLYISDTEIKGHTDNYNTITKNGITYNNAYFVLRYVIGF